MVIKKLATLFVISLCSFQMAFAQTIENSRQVASFTDLDDLMAEIAKIKKELRGNISSELSEEELSAYEQAFRMQNAQESEGATGEKNDFITFLGSLKKNSCGASGYIDEGQQKDDVEKDNGRGQNLFSDIAKIASEVEVGESLNRSQTRYIKGYARKARAYFLRAKSVKNKVEDLINNTNEAYADKEELLLAYNDSLVKGLHDVKVALTPFVNMSDLDINSILPRLTTDFISEETELYSFLVNGEMKDKIFFKVNIDGSDVELELDTFQNFKRDIVTINESPSAKNYLRALRILTIQMMATQIRNYDIMIGSLENHVVIPKSCRNKVNGDWPHLLELKVDESVAQSYLDNLIKNSGLAYDDMSLELMSVKEAQNLNPMAETMVSSTSIENFLRAAKGKEGKDFYNSTLKAGFDEISAYEKFLEMKMPEVSAKYRTKVYTSHGRSRKSKDVTTKDITLIQDIIGTVPENKTIEVDIFEGEQRYVEQIYPSAVNASPYLASKMAQARTENIEDIISDSIKSQLKSNRIIVDFPSLYANENYRNWGLNTLYQKVTELQDSDGFAVGTRHNTMLAGYCYRKPGKLCRNISRNSNVLEKVGEYIESLKIDGKYIPVSRLDQARTKDSYVVLGRIFNYLRSTARVFPELITNEYDYLIGQMHALNPIAKVRLGYLIAREELESIKNGRVKKMKKTSRGMRVDYSYRCFNSNMKKYIENLDEAAETLMADKIITPNFLTKNVKKDEYKMLWNEIYDKYNNDTTQIMTAKLNTGKKAYEAIEELSNKVTLDRSQIEDAAYEAVQGRLIYQTQEDIDNRLLEEDVEKVAFYKEILAAKSHKERQAIFDSRPGYIDIFDDYELVHNFLKLNMDLKTPVYKDILKRSALERQQDTYRKLNSFCQIEEDDVDSLKENFYATVKIQDQLNQLLGIPAVPKELMDRMSDWNSDEKWAMFNGVFGFLLGMGAVMAAGSCTVLTGGLCGVVIAGVGTVGFGMQANAIRLETRAKFRADRSEDYVGQMADLGFTDSNAAENVAKGWMAVAFEVIGTISMISILTRSVSVGSKIFKESLKSIVRNRSKLGIKESLKQSGKDASVIVNESEVEFAKLVLGLKKYRDVFKNLLSAKTMDDIAYNLKNLDLDEEFVEQTLKKMEKIEASYKAGKLSKASYNKGISNIVKSVEGAITKSHGGIYRYTSDVIVDLKYADVDKALGQTVSKLFNGSPLELRHYMGSYVKRLNKRSFGRSSKAAKAKLRLRNAQQGKYMMGTNWIVQAWNENTANLAKSRRQFLKMYDELQRLPESELADYITKNADTLTDIFIKIPLRKRDFPYLLIQGAPHTGGFFGRRVPVFSAMGEGVLMRKIFTARARLTSEVARRTARETLGMKRVLMAETVGDLYRGLEASLLEALPKMGQKEVAQVEKMIAKVKEKALTGIIDNLESDEAVLKFMHKHGVSLDGLTPDQTYSELNRILFSPVGEVENVLSRYLWASANMEELFKAPEFSGLAYKVMRDTIEESNIGSLQRYLNALKILKIKDNGALGSVELF